MKKLMFALAIAAVGSAFAIESSNIVGYTGTASSASGGKMISGSFLCVTTSNGTFKLGDLSFTGYDPEEGCWGSALIQEKDAFGRDTNSYYWNDYDDGEGTVKRGWYDGDGEVQWSNDIAFDEGTAFWVQGEGYTLVSAGAVNFESVTFDSNASGGTAIGNPYPVAITLADISFSGYDPEEGCWGSALIQEKDSFGRITNSYYWNDYDDGEGTIKCGWYDGDGEVQWPDTTPFAVGTGFWVQGEGNTLEFTFPVSK